MKSVLLGVGAAVVLALGGAGVTNLAAGADHSGTGRQHAPATAEHRNDGQNKPSTPGQTGAQHSQQMRAFAQAHKDGMRAWQKCHRAGRPTCVKPAPPGWLKHPDKHPGGWPPGHQQTHKGDKGEKDDHADDHADGDADGDIDGQTDGQTNRD